jgi:hypothetical protein
VGLAIAASPAVAAVHYFTQTTTLYKFNSTTNTLSTGVAIQGLQSGETVPGLGFLGSQLWATTTAGNVYTIDAAGNATLQFSFSGTPSVTTFDFIDVTGEGNVDLVALSGNQVLAYDFTDGIGELTAQTNSAGAGFPSSAFVGGTYYGAQNTSELFTIDPTTGTAAKTQDITDADNGGVALSWNLAGGSEYAGDYWLAVTQGNDVRLGILDLTTGSFDDAFSFTGLGGSAMGYAVIPAPGAVLLGLMGTGIIGALRRRIG